MTVIVRRDLCNGLKDEEAASFRMLFDQMGRHLNQTLIDLRKQEALINEVKRNLTAIRSNCIRMFYSVYNMNSKIPWLKRNIYAGWIAYYKAAKERHKIITEGEVEG